MGRRTVYNNITSAEKLAQVNPENIQLAEDYIDHMIATDHAETTMNQYRHNLNIFWCWNLEFNKNKFYIDITKREYAKFQSHALKVWGWSAKRVRTVRATMSSFDNYIVRVLDDEFPDFRQIVSAVDPPVDVAVREKTVFTDQDIQMLLDTLVEKKKYKMACILSLAANSGRRKAELCRFKASYFTKENTICGGALYKTPEKIKTKGRGKNGKMLDVYVLAKPFQKYLDLWMDERKKLGIESEWLFPKREKDGTFIDEPITAESLNSVTGSFSKQLGKPFYWHSLRHFFTTKLVSANIPDSVIQDVIGWESSDMIRIYDDSPKDQKFEKYFGGDGIKTVENGSLEEL